MSQQRPIGRPIADGTRSPQGWPTTERYFKIGREPWRPAYEGGPPVPPEPFPYASSPRSSSFRSPVGIAINGLGSLGLGIGAVIYLGPTDPFGLSMLVVFGLLSVPFFYVAWVRERWKRAYTRIIGHSPWQGL